MFKLFKNLYNWVLKWAETKYSSLALFIISLSESIFFPIPPDILLIALSIGKRSKSIYFAFICSLGSVIGALIGYGIGYYMWWDANNYSNLAQFFLDNIPGFTKEVFLEIKHNYDNYGFLIIFTAGFTPIPFKVFTISSGAFKISITSFLLASSTSRSVRFILISFLIWIYGDNIKFFIEKYFNLLCILFSMIIICGFIILKSI